ncbi:hypothetical protein C1H76_7339 [Elsinoe australis]|uniref:Uncharacterized protein n=1 Tax=Elsinoe australis TaxID=40998 RepID=A0A4U7AQP2_9PEZI|nr:hypothetical protein C1H76_7339 [Elsinoe australis]
MIRTILNIILGAFLYLYNVFESLLSLNFPYRLQLFEFGDLYLVPTFIKYHFQITLTAQWTRRLPLLQSHAPAHHATALLTQILANITDTATTPYTIIEFCSGAGGPTPHIERAVNAARLRSNLPPILFRLSDIVPNLEAWIPLSAASEHLSFIPQPVNALDPPPSTISVSSRGGIHVPLSGEYADEEVSVTGKVTVDEGRQVQRERDREAMKATCTARTKVMHLFCLSFHHFEDEDARRVIRSMLSNSDAFCVVELQERSLGCLAMLALEPVLLFLVSWYWFWGDWSQLFWTYVVPVLPVLHGWDGVVSCLRTRTFGEMREMIDGVIAEARREMEKDLVFNGQPKGRWQGVVQDQWTISEARAKHTWPAGYLHATIGIRKEIRRGMD